MKTFKRALCAASLDAFAGATLMGVTARATASIGDRLDARYFFPDAASIDETSGVFTFTDDGQTIPTQGGVTSVIVNAASVIVSATRDCGLRCSHTSAGFDDSTPLDLTNSSTFAGWGVKSDTGGIASAILTSGVGWQGAPARGSANLSAMPNPATWALMIGSFGLIGRAMRGQRRQMTVTYA